MGCDEWDTGIGIGYSSQQKSIAERLQERVEFFRELPDRREAVRVEKLSGIESAVRSLAEVCPAITFGDSPDWYTKTTVYFRRAVAFYIGKTFYSFFVNVDDGCNASIEGNSWPTPLHRNPRDSYSFLYGGRILNCTDAFIDFLIDEAAKVTAREPVADASV